ncbi:unnamed protein product [Ectocarpus sp. 6 AP-2014]
MVSWKETSTLPRANAAAARSAARPASSSCLHLPREAPRNVRLLLLHLSLQVLLDAARVLVEATLDDLVHWLEAGTVLLLNPGLCAREIGAELHPITLRQGVAGGSALPPSAITSPPPPPRERQQNFDARTTTSTSKAPNSRS